MFSGCILCKYQSYMSVTYESKSYVSLISVLYQSHISYKSVTCQSYISHISVIYQSYTSHVSTIYQSYVSHTSVTYQSFISHTYILKDGDRGDRSPPIFFIFRQNLGWERENQQDWTAPMPLHPFVVFALFSIYPLLI